MLHNIPKYLIDDTYVKGLPQNISSAQACRWHILIATDLTQLNFTSKSTA